MTSTLHPASPQDVLDAIAWAAGEETPLEIIGHGSKRGIGRPVQAEWTLDLSGLSGVTLYEPDELVLSARAGTPLSEIETLLSAHGQQLDFEPMDHGPLFGAEPGRGTIGGALAANLSGPRRPKVGAARDHILGIRAVSGRGEAFKAGGRVVKNVTGYDLSKGLASSWGTLAVLTDVTFKVLPKPETEASLALSGLDDAAAIRALCAAMGSSCEVSGAAHLPDGVATSLNGGFGGGRAHTVLRLEGFGPSVAYRAEKLRALLGVFGAADILPADISAHLWRAVRDVIPFAESDRPLWRVSVAPTAGPAVASALRAEPVEVFYDWSGGLLWIEVGEGASGDDALAGLIRTAVEASGGGHATLVRGSPALRTAVPPFQPQPAALAALSKRLKENFDPKGVLNPGRFA